MRNVDTADKRSVGYEENLVDITISGVSWQDFEEFVFVTSIVIDRAGRFLALCAKELYRTILH